MKPISNSSVQNQAEIYSILKTLLKDSKHLLEIGSGTGQHAVYFAERLPHLIWQTSDQQQYHQGIKLWLNEAQLDNTRTPIRLNVSNDVWPEIDVDAIFSANVVHIMSWGDVVNYFTHATKLLKKEGLFILYGPFNYASKYTSQSNAKFDDWLKTENPESAIRDFNALDELANKNQMTLSDDIEMAMNNRILCWKKSN